MQSGDVEGNFDDIPRKILQLDVGELRLGSGYGAWGRNFDRLEIKTIGELLTQLRSMKDVSSTLGGIGSVSKAKLRDELIRIGIDEKIVSQIRALN